MDLGVKMKPSRTQEGMLNAETRITFSVRDSKDIKLKSIGMKTVVR
jgi:hypothetical protein